MSEDSLHYYLISMVESIVDEGQLNYVAGCLNSGRTYYQAIAQGEQLDSEAHRRSNEQVMRAFIAELRKGGLTVLDPSVLRVAEWTDRKTGNFFIDLIGRFVGCAWFLDGWEYSSGATKEYLFCLNNGIETVNETGSIIDRQLANELLSKAVSDVRAQGLGGGKLEARLIGLAEA